MVTVYNMFMSGTLYIVGTPIGNREDITLRALKVLYSVSVILTEDTRITDRLFSMYDEELLGALGLADSQQKPRLVRFGEHTERKRVPQVVEWLEQGYDVALVSESGMPLVSDPGFVLVREIIAKGLKIEVVPGPSALTSAMVVSGLPVDQVLFLGFLPKKTGKRKKIWEKLNYLREDGALHPTVMIYESPFRLKKTLEEILLEVGDVEVALVAELTKKYEKVLRGKASEVIGDLPEKVKGEWVILLNLKSPAKS